MSIGNVTKANHSEGIKVMYTTDVISEQEAVNRYGKENVETIGNKHIRITHKILVGLEMIRMLMVI